MPDTHGVHAVSALRSLGVTTISGLPRWTHFNWPILWSTCHIHCDVSRLAASDALFTFRARNLLSARPSMCRQFATVQLHGCTCAGGLRSRIRHFELSLFAGMLPCC
jgi:hypothetical protein